MDFFGIFLSVSGAALAKDVRWRIDGVGDRDSRCRSFIKEIRLRKCTDYDCSYDAIVESGGFSEPPWEELDPKEYQDLISKLHFWAQSNYRYLKRKQGKVDGEDGNLTYGKYYVDRGGRLRVWRAKLSESDKNEEESTFQKSRTIVELLYPLAGSKVNKSTFLASSDLRDPDFDVDESVASTLQGSALYLMKGDPYFIRGSQVSYLKSGELRTLCLFRVDGQ